MWWESTGTAKARGPVAIPKKGVTLEKRAAGGLLG
jgi:hypothetical protein